MCFVINILHLNVKMAVEWVERKRNPSVKPTKMGFTFALPIQTATNLAVGLNNVQPNVSKQLDCHFAVCFENIHSI